jgi:hypothetical protein
VYIAPTIANTAVASRRITVAGAETASTDNRVMRRFDAIAACQRAMNSGSLLSL